jgi:large subunit ribosomal protein L4
MPNIPMYNSAGQQVGEIEANAALFDVEPGPGVVHAAVTAHLAGQRAGTASTKGRSEVAGGGRKPWRQKGTGRARHGSRRSPLWRHGATAMGPKPRDYSQRLPKKARRKALAAILTDRLRSGLITLVDRLELEQPSTRALMQLLDNLKVDTTAGRTLLVDAEPSRELELSARNLPGVSVVTAAALNIYDVAVSDRLVLTHAGLERLQETRI